MQRDFLSMTIMLAFIVPATGAQVSPASSAQKPYTLDQTVRAVVLDVAVTNANGTPIRGLKESDFQVAEDGVPQQTRLFEDMGEHRLPANAGTKTGPALLRETGDAPITVLLLDHVSTEPEDLHYAKEQIAKFLQGQPERLTSPTALMALTGSSLKTLMDFTLDRDRLIEGIKSDHDTSSWYVLRDRSPTMKSTGLWSSGERFTIYGGVLQQLAASLSSYPVRKNLVWVGPGLPALDQVMALNGPYIDAMRRIVHRLTTDLVLGRITMYTVDPQGLLVTPTEIATVHLGGSGDTQMFVKGGDAAEGDLAFEALAPATGGRIFRMRNDVAVELKQSVEDGENYYTLSYDPSNKRFDGSYRKISVVVNRPGAVVRTRTGYVASEPGSSHPANAIALALTSRLHYAGLRTSARLVRPAELDVTVQTADLHWTPMATEPQAAGDNLQKESAQISVATAEVTKAGKMRSYNVQTMHATASAAAVLAGSADFLVHVPRELNGTVLRVVVRDQSTGHLGSADVPLQ